MRFVCLQKKCEQLQQEQKELMAMRDEQQQLAQQFRQRATKLAQSLEENQRLNKEKIEREQVCFPAQHIAGSRFLFVKILFYTET